MIKQLFFCGLLLIHQAAYTIHLNRKTSGIAGAILAATGTIGLGLYWRVLNRRLAKEANQGKKAALHRELTRIKILMASAGAIAAGSAVAATIASEKASSISNVQHSSLTPIPISDATPIPISDATPIPILDERLETETTNAVLNIAHSTPPVIPMTEDIPTSTPPLRTFILQNDDQSTSIVHVPERPSWMIKDHKITLSDATPNSTFQAITIDWWNLAQDAFEYIPKEIITQSFLLQGQYAYKVRGMKDIELTNKQTITVYADSILSFHKSRALVVINRPDDTLGVSLKIIQIKASEISDTFYGFFTENGDDTQKKDLAMWKDKSKAFCMCVVCKRRPYPNGAELDASLSQKDASTMHKQQWFCHSCGTSHHQEEQCCSCPAFSNQWRCNICGQTNPTTNLFCTRAILEDSEEWARYDARPSQFGQSRERTTRECRNVFMSSKDIVPLWECPTCCHVNKNSDQKCQSQKLDADQRISYCGTRNPGKVLFFSLLDTSPALAAEYYLYLRKGGYHLTNDLQYCDKSKVTIVEAATTNLQDYINQDIYVKINAADYTDARPDGLCGYRAVVGEFEDSRPTASLNLQKALNKTDWMGAPSEACNVVNRHIITLSPAGFTNTHLLYKIRTDGSKKCTTAPTNSYPIIIIKASAANIHFARLLPIYSDQPSYYYEKFTMTTNAQGANVFHATQINRS